MTGAVTAATIHPTAIVDPGAQVADDVVIGPYTSIGEHVIIGRGTRVDSRVVIEGHTTIGEDNQVFTGAIIGTIPQDLKYQGEETRVVIGNSNRVREYVTINIGTIGGGGVTQLGNDNLLMAYAHVAHDCQVGDHVVIANNGTLAGHITIEDYAIVGGLAAIHQFARVGRMALIGGCSKVTQDVPPYSTCDGHPARVVGINSEGMRRWGISPDVRKQLKEAYRVVFRSGTPLQEALDQVELSHELSGVAEVHHLIEFIRTSKRGVCRW